MPRRAALKKGEPRGTESPKKGWPAVPRAARSASARGCGRKKIEMHQYKLKDGSRLSCGHSRASGRFPPSRTTDKCCFSGICKPQQAALNICSLSCCGGRPRHRRPPAWVKGDSPPLPPLDCTPHSPTNPNLKHAAIGYQKICKGEQAEPIGLRR